MLDVTFEGRVSNKLRTWSEKDGKHTFLRNLFVEIFVF